jgi:thiamine-phosphate pyrophosphorylase
MKSKIQYISQGNTAAIQIENIKSVLDAGCNWVQLRYKNVPEAAVLNLAEQVKKMMEGYDCTFIINDFPQVAKAVDADGIHLGLGDMDVSEARAIIGSDKIIGGTANTLSDVLKCHVERCDYIGLGPFRFTATKDKLSPILGLQGYKTIMDRLIELDITMPVYAIGGIKEEDIASILETGIYGVSLSGYITGHPQKKELFSQLHAL